MLRPQHTANTSLRRHQPENQRIFSVYSCAETFLKPLIQPQRRDLRPVYAVYSRTAFWTVTSFVPHTPFFIKQRRSDVHFNKEEKKKRERKAGGWGGPSRHPVAYWRWDILSRKSWLISHWALVSIATTPRSSVRMAWSWSEKNMQPHRHRH